MQTWVEFPLTRGKVALVDVSDLLILAQFRWQATPTNGLWYAQRSSSANGRSYSERMHRRIMQPPPGLVVDHINHNTLDNRRANLRLATPLQNVAHRASKTSAGRWFIGVTPARSRSGWCARIKMAGRGTVQVGTFLTAAEAALAYDHAARSLHGEFATTNERIPESRRMEIIAAAATHDAGREQSWTRKKK